MAAVFELKVKKSGKETKNSMREKRRVKTLIVLAFSLLMKRRKMAPASGKKINRDRIGIPNIVMKPTPLLFHPPYEMGDKGRF